MAGVTSQGVRVSVETVLLGVADTQITYRIAVGRLGGDDHPGALACVLAGPDDARRLAAALYLVPLRPYPRHTDPVVTACADV